MIDSAVADAPRKTKVAIIGSGNIGTDLMVKILRSDGQLEVAALVGIDEHSDGLAKARRRGVRTVHTGVAGLMDLPDFGEIRFVFDATSAAAHRDNAAALAGTRITLIDLTPAAIGPYVVPPVNLEEHLGSSNLNMVTCGGQATIPIVAAVNSVTPVVYAEIVASIASRSAGPGTRANIDEFTETTARALEVVGGAARGKAIIVLNPADPPTLMRDTVICIVGNCDEAAVRDSVVAMVASVSEYVPGYRLKQDVQFEPIADDEPLENLIGAPRPTNATKVSVYLEIEGAADYLPAFAGNLDIMTAAAARVAEKLATRDALAGVAS